MDSWACVHCVLSSSSIRCKLPSLNSPSNSVCIHSIHTRTVPFNRPVIDKIEICPAVCVCVFARLQRASWTRILSLPVSHVCVWQGALSRVRQWCNAYPTAHLERCRGQVQIELLCKAPSRYQLYPLAPLQGPTKGASVLVWAFVYDVVTRWSICLTLRMFYRETLRSVPVQRIINLSPSDICTYSFNKWFSLEWLSTEQSQSVREREKRDEQKNSNAADYSFRSV